MSRRAERYARPSRPAKTKSTSEGDAGSKELLGDLVEADDACVDDAGTFDAREPCVHEGRVAALRLEAPDGILTGPWGCMGRGLYGAEWLGGTALPDST